MEDTMRFGHLMEAALYITESEGKLFDTLIKLNFQQAVKEQEGDGADEETKEKIEKENNLKSKFTAENIRNKFEEISIKVKAMIEKAIEAVINKLLGFIKADSKIIKRYKEAINNANLSAFPGINNFSMPKGFPREVDCINLSKYLSDYNDPSIGFSDAIKDAEAYIDGLFPKEEELYKPDDATLKKDAITAIDGISEASTVLKELRSQKWTAKIDEIKRKFVTKNIKAADEESTNFDALAGWCKLISKVCNIYINGCIKVFKSYRKLALSVGTFAIKQTINTKKNVSLNDADAQNYNANEDDIKESVEALVYIVGESSDMAVDEAFAY